MGETQRSAYAALVEAGTTAMNGGQKDRHGRWTGEVHTVLGAVLPVLAEQVRQASYRAEVTTRDYGPAVHPDFAADLIEEMAESVANPDSPAARP